ncbi:MULTISPECIES: hypothetical protein [unclassified Halomonas]|uniref:hypothetical protein n=1 Tax=unclassified Halomonas TaxID=2609666 RepID=UPI0020767C81|nr:MULTISPECIES: hypothetical protein [unclassified Halomonas]
MGQQSRPLSDLERYHARTVYTGLKLQDGLILMGGSVFLLLSLGLPVAFFLDGKRLVLSEIMMIGLATLLLAALSTLAILYARHHVTLASTATALQGTLVRKRRRQMNPVTGVGHTRYVDFIDDIELRWPAGADAIVDPLEGQYIELKIAVIEITHGSTWTRLREWVGSARARPRQVGVVLEYEKAIHIHGALAQYGRRYLLRYRARLTAVVTFIVALSLFILIQPATTHFLVRTNFLLSLLAIVGYVAGAFMITLLVGKVIKALRRRFDPGFDETPHEERLKG